MECIGNSFSCEIMHDDQIGFKLLCIYDITEDVKIYLSCRCITGINFRMDKDKEGALREFLL